MILVIGGRNQGKSKFVYENFSDMNIINGFHEIIRSCLSKGKSIKELLDRTLKEADVIVSDEIGCGIVPAEKFERMWREECGRALCIIAENAEKVYRVNAGIAMRIK